MEEEQSSGEIAWFSYTRYTIPLEWSIRSSGDVSGLVAVIRTYQENITAHGSDGGFHTESDRGDYDYYEDTTGMYASGPSNYTIKIIQDDKAEEDETFYVYIRPVGFSGVDDEGRWAVTNDREVWCGRCRATVTIIDND